MCWGRGTMKMPRSADLRPAGFNGAVRARDRWRQGAKMSSDLLQMSGIRKLGSFYVFLILFCVGFVLTLTH